MRRTGDRSLEWPTVAWTKRQEMLLSKKRRELTGLRAGAAFVMPFFEALADILLQFADKLKSYIRTFCCRSSQNIHNILLPGSLSVLTSC